MFDLMTGAVTAFKNAAAKVDYGRLTGADAARLVQICLDAERAVAAIRTLAARRVEESKVWQRNGHRNAAEWLASESGSSVGHAFRVLETARRLDDLPLTREAFRAGQLSEVQAREVSDAAYADPRREKALLAAAQSETVRTLQEECRRVKAAAVPDEIERYKSIHRRRYLRTWRDAEGAVRLDARLTPDAGAELFATLDVTRDRISNDARRAGRRESSEAYAADALVELVTRPDGSSKGRARAMVHVLVDHSALTRGAVRPGERCEIPGVGPIPIRSAESLSHDAIIKAILSDGTDIRKVVTVGRTVPDRVRTALEVRDQVCVVPRCDQRRRLEIDHYRVRYADGGPTKLENLARVCGWHHHLKTHCGYRLSGGPGAWRWQSPEDVEGDHAEARLPEP